MWELILKGALGATVAILFALLGKAGKGEMAGMLSLFPVFSLLGYFLVASSGNVDTLKEAVRTSLIGLPVLVAFFVAVLLLLSYLDWKLALLVALLVWVVLAMIWIRFVL